MDAATHSSLHGMARSREGEVRPSTQPMMALMELAGSLGLGHTTPSH